MCGVVAYFGSAGNNITRVMTGMSAIIYRAPDSTGVGMFGNDSRPIWIKKAVGSVDKLVEILLDSPAYQNDTAELIALWSEGTENKSTQKNQKRLIVFEGLPLAAFDRIAEGHAAYPSYDDMVALAPNELIFLSPGQPGRHDLNFFFRIRSKSDFRRLVLLLITEYDLPPEVIRIIIRKPLIEKINQKKERGETLLGNEDILAAFDLVYQKVLGDVPVKKDYSVRRRERLLVKPIALKTLWRCLAETLIPSPSDYVRDGVRCLFRVIDAALFTRPSFGPEVIESIEKIMETSWPLHERSKTVSWLNLYRAEKGVNLYGRAAAAALTWLKRDEFLTAILADLSKQEMMREPAIVPDQTDPVSLRYYAQPVIGHGRWALQSAVTSKNAHPFTDQKQERCVVLNGQFDPNVEGRLKQFLSKVARYSFKSDNSSEYFPLLWAYYFDQLVKAKERYRDVAAQVDYGLEAHGIGSQTIDFAIHRSVKDKTTQALDEMAFIQTAKQIAQKEGQVAACGISIHSMGKLYVVSHNRPIFIVRRLETSDYMVVSDINAAMGLFPQKMIIEKRQALQNLKGDYTGMATGFESSEIHPPDPAYEQKKQSILKAFAVEIHPLEGEELFARLETTIERGQTIRHLEITDFDGNALPEIEPFTTVLHPAQVKQHLGRSFYETHLNEIPDRLKFILRRYAPREDQIPLFPVRRKRLKRAFGPGYRDLKRLVLVGTGSAYHMGKMAEGLAHAVMPEIDVITIRPGDAGHVERFFAAKTDLVVMMSWSATTAHMVVLAHALLKQKVTMVGLTEKVFGDMALAVAKSGGIIPVLSEEEVTVVGVKSTVCMLFCLDLFILWIGSKIGRREEALVYLEAMHRLPFQLANLLSDDALTPILEQMAQEHADALAGIIVSALYTDGTGAEAALKIEENTWSMVGKALDYQEVLNTGLPTHFGKAFLIVDATCPNRVDEALDVMDFFTRNKIAFIAIGIVGIAQKRIQALSQGQSLFIPKIKKTAFQSFISLLLYYKLTFHCGHACGIGVGVIPRNLAKSLTVSRSRYAIKKDPVARVLMEMRTLQEQKNEQPPEPSAFDEATVWEKNARSERSILYYRDIRALIQQLILSDSIRDCCPNDDHNMTTLADLLFSEDSAIEEIVFLPMDNRSKAAMSAVADIWGHLLDLSIRIVTPEAHLAALEESTLLISAVTSSLNKKRLTKHLESTACTSVSFWPGMDDNCQRFDSAGTVYFLYKNRFRYALSDYLSALLHRIMIGAWDRYLPKKAAVLATQFKSLAQTMQVVLGDRALKSEIANCSAANHKYKTMFYIGPPVGIGASWSDLFDRIDGILLTPHLYGESGHGPLVTVDSQVENKFVMLRWRKEMVSDFGEKRVARWENDYLRGVKVDVFLAAPADILPSEKDMPFFVNGQWYIPELLPDYNTAKDNLILIDASHPRYFDQALDEISTFGCRFSRMILVTQQAFLEEQGQAFLYRYPVSGTIILPRIAGAPIPPMHLPAVMNLIGMELATCMKGQMTAR